MIKIALLSDIHFGIDSRSKDFAIPGQQIIDETEGGESLYSGLESILSQFGPAYIFCTGDLTSTGKPLEYKYCLDKIYQLAKQVSVMRKNVIYCFGNHDVDYQITDLFAKENSRLHRDLTEDEIKFVRRYYDEMTHSWLYNSKFMDEVESYRDFFTTPGPIPASGVFERDGMSIFTLNSAFLCTDEQSIKHGKITGFQLQWLANELQQRNESNTWKVVILHHHPFNYSFPTLGLDSSTLEEGAELLELCGKYGVHLIIHGHRHHPRAKTLIEGAWLNPITFISAGSLSINQAGRSSGQIPNTFHLIELEDTPGCLKLMTYEYAIGEGWKKVSCNRPALPLDKEVYLGKVTIGDESAIEIIRQFPTGIPIKFEEINQSLKFISVQHLNDLVARTYALNLSGAFPGEIMIHNNDNKEQRNG